MPSGEFPRMSVFEGPNLNNDHDSCIHHVVPCGHRCEKAGISVCNLLQHVGYAMAVRTCASELELGPRSGLRTLPVTVLKLADTATANFVSLDHVDKVKLYSTFILVVHSPRAGKVVWNGRCRSTRCR